MKDKIRIVLLSDTHTYLNKIEIPEGDLLVHCGDALSYGSMDELIHFGNVFSKLSDSFPLGSIYVPGNHDRCVERDPGVAKTMFSKSVRMLLHEPVEIEGFKFFGSPWTPEFGNWAFGYSRDKGRYLWGQIPHDTDVLITHGMPYQILDRVGHVLFGEDSDGSVGCRYLRKKVKSLPKLKLYAGGHLHLQGGQSVEMYGKLFLNAAICDDAYIPNRKPFVVELTKDGAKLV